MCLNQSLWPDGGMFWQGLGRILISGGFGAGVKGGISGTVPKPNGMGFPHWSEGFCCQKGKEY